MSSAQRAPLTGSFAPFSGDASPPGLVPCGGVDLVERVGRPADDVEPVEDAFGHGAPAERALVDPPRPVAGDDPDGFALGGRELLEEQVEDLPPWPWRIQMTRPRSWSTTTVMYVCPRLQLVSSTPMERRSSNRPALCSALRSSATRLRTGPVLFQSTRISADTALRGACTLNHAVRRSKSYVYALFLRAHGTITTVTPYSPQPTRGGAYSSRSLTQPISR